MAHSSNVFSVCSAECTLVEEIEINEDESTFLLTNHLHSLVYVTYIVQWIIEFAAQIIQDVLSIWVHHIKIFSLSIIVITSVDT